MYDHRLFVAADDGDLNIVKLLLKKGADIEYRSKIHDWTPLMMAVKKGHLNMVKLLLENGANTEVRNAADWTPLTLAAKYGYLNIVKLLLEKGASMDATTKYQSPKKIAKEHGNWDVYNYLKSPSSMSNVEIIKKQGIFTSPSNTSITPVTKPKVVEFPEEFTCLITHELMTNPVVCTLDGMTYEKNAITEWLSKHRNSPYNRKTMKPGEEIKDVLIKNRNLAAAIETFRQNNLQSFSTQKLKAM